MEDMARLALVEQNLRDTEKFTKLLHELLRLINYILENPHDYELRRISSDLLKKHLDNEAFGDYLKYVGFQAVDNEMEYPKEQTLSKLRMAQAALERKIGFCCGKAVPERTSLRPSCTRVQASKPKLTPANVLNTKNPLLLKIEALFNSVLRYEEEELVRAARAALPLPALQLAALDRLREHQRALKAGEIKGQDMPFDVALLAELVGWFKHKFFKWVDKPPCDACGGPTTFVGSDSMRTPTETCTVELYRCTACPGRAQFPRYNCPRALLRTRRGRCGEWASCFTLLCRALGYDTRYVYDTTDHVWCEVYDYDSKSWLHVDPCEAKLDTPLMYSAGWGKKLSYVIAVSRDDLQDVTWRYTTDHKEVLKRRNLCSERELIASILSLRQHRQRQVSEARRRYLARRTLEELAQLMVQRTPSSYEHGGRVSGAAAWRAARGEAGRGGHVFRFRGVGRAAVRYYCAADEYRVTHPDPPTDPEQSIIRSWSAGAYTIKDVFRKVEEDWQKVYLAREEGTSEGSISWCISAEEGSVGSALRLRAGGAAFRGASVCWTLRFDQGQPQTVELSDTPAVFTRRFRTIELHATLSGGEGREAWQHAQLFRQPLADPTPALEIHITLEQDL